VLDRGRGDGVLEQVMRARVLMRQWPPLNGAVEAVEKAYFIGMHQ